MRRIANDVLREGKGGVGAQYPIYGADAGSSTGEGLRSPNLAKFNHQPEGIVHFLLARKDFCGRVKQSAATRRPIAGWLFSFFNYKNSVLAASYWEGVVGLTDLESVTSCVSSKRPRPTFPRYVYHLQPTANRGNLDPGVQTAPKRPRRDKTIAAVRTPAPLAV